MIGKIITKRSDGGDPHNLMAYLVHGTGKDREQRKPRCSSINFLNTHCENWKDFAHDCQTRRDAADGRDNIYHFVLSVQEQDKNATDQQLIQAAKIAIKELGLEEHTAVAVVHRDTDNPHVHLALDLVHPDTYRRKPRPSHDFAKLAKACRLAEAKLGFAQDRGHWAGDRAAAAILGQADPAKPSRAPRKNGTRDGDAQSAAAGSSFQSRIENNQTLKAIFSESSSWTDLQARLSAHGRQHFESDLIYKAFGSGAILALSDDPSARGKASLIHSSCSLSKLEKRFGPIPHQSRPAAASAPTSRPTSPAKDNLWEEYQQLKSSHKTNKAGAERLRKTLFERQKAEINQLQAAHRQERRALHSQFFWSHADRIKADSARALTAAQRRETLENRHKLEKQALARLGRFPSWCEWLTTEAQTNPTAAARLARSKPEAPKSAPTSTLSDLKAEADKKTGFTAYRSTDGRLRIEDSGKRISIARSVHMTLVEREAAVLAALRLSIEKYGVNSVNITSNRAEVIRIAGKNGVWIGGLNAAEQIQWQAFRSASFSNSRTRHAQNPDTTATADHARRTRHNQQQEPHHASRTHLPDLHLQKDKTRFNGI